MSLPSIYTFITMPKNLLTQFDELYRLIWVDKHRGVDVNIPDYLVLLLITERGYIHISEGNCVYSPSPHGKGLLDLDRMERGRVLESFIRTEFIVRELLLLSVLGFNSPKRRIMDKVLDAVNFSQQLKCLHDAEIIPRGLRNSLDNLRAVRNAFAHRWDESQALYRGDKLSNAHRSFADDFLKSFEELIEIYERLQEGFDLASVIRVIRGMDV